MEIRLNPDGTHEQSMEGGRRTVLVMPRNFIVKDIPFTRIQRQNGQRRVQLAPRRRPYVVLRNGQPIIEMKIGDSDDISVTRC